MYTVSYTHLDVYKRQTDFIRLPLARVELVAGKGLRGDRKAGRNPDRQVNILSAEWLQMAATRGYRTGPGQFGEQLIVAGLDAVSYTHLDVYKRQLEHGADLNAVKELLGHAGLAATQVYTHNTVEKLRKVHAQAHPRGGGQLQEPQKTS